ncbi:YOR220W [Saccharomyces arboricola H-6]|uniref:YOR220W n=1 Tax=Saccharomyces arboricola (strain H-6 / AS 2.3317 / CBS 10644) TaxID=1160507 RepID=J8Q219_SACAR|nr:YOR220W [Saccharomyces arboricola H-6]
MANQKQMRTQILITDIPTDKFTSKWPTHLEKTLFKEQFPNLQSHLQYYTPLPFLNRIIIIFDNEDDTLHVFEFLQELLAKENGGSMKLFVTESLLNNQHPRSRSTDDAAALQGNNSSPLVEEHHSKPLLSINTDPGVTGMDGSSLNRGGSSLSPDKSSFESPTLLKLSTDSKPFSYQEPLPKLSRSSSSTSNFSLNGSSLTSLPSQPENKDKSTSDTKCLFVSKPMGLTIDTSATNNTALHIENDANGTSSNPPKSPSITVNEFFH